MWLVGETGSGKTRAAVALLDTWERNARRQWLAAPARIRGASPLAVVIDVKRQLPQPVRGLRVRPPLGDALDVEALGPHHDLVNAWCAWAYRRGNAAVFVDEVDLACRGAGRPPPALVGLLHHGRARGMAPIVCCRRYCEIPPAVRSQCEDLYVFRTHEPADLSYFADLGLPADQLQGLPVGAFFHLRPSRPGGAHLHRDFFAPCAQEG